MTRPLIAALALTMLLSACGTIRESRFNPFTWFGSSEEVTLTPDGGYAVVRDNRALVAQRGVAIDGGEERGLEDGVHAQAQQHVVRRHAGMRATALRQDTERITDEDRAGFKRPGGNGDVIKE